MLLAIMIGVAIAYLLFLTALYVLFRADAWNKLFLRQLKLPGTGATEGTAFEGFERDDRSNADSSLNASSFALPMEISDKGGRRSGIDRRECSHIYQLPKAWYGPEQRSGLERRSGLDRRHRVTFMREGIERRAAFKVTV